MFYSFLILISVFFTAGVKVKKAEIITLQQLRAKTIRQDNDTLYVVNFWATWCKPCVAELPYFEEAREHFIDKPVKLLLVSLDLLSDEQKVDVFIQNKNIQNEVCLLNAADPNTWINEIDSTWSGAIPATIIYKRGKTIFFQEGDFEKLELDSLIQTKIN